MITIILLFAAVFVVLGAIYLAMMSGNKGGRHNQSSASVAREQENRNRRS